MEYLNQLNTEQRLAVEYTNGPLLVLAGAGTGKTSVLTRRVVHIINSALAIPNNILAVTFTNKASKEMNERISAMIDSSGLNIGTFHSVAAKILRNHAECVELSSGFSIIDGDDQLKLVKQLLVDRGVDIKQYLPKVISSIISRWKDSGILPYKVSDNDLTSQAYHIALDIYKKYQSKLLHSNAVDFGDLLLYNKEIFITYPDILNIYQNKFQYIMIDEYQDTNAVQYVWARMLANQHNNLCCVGDDDQSIYGWRGAEVGNILRFEKDFPDAKVIKLERNYRSSTPILTAASSIIKNNKQRHGKTLWTELNTGELINVVSCWNDREEARYITSEISKLLSNQITANEIAILVRAGFQTRPFEEALIAKAIPYKIVGGLKFYDRMEIKDAIAYIRVILNNDDDLAFERIVNVPKRSIGTVTLNLIKANAIELNTSMISAIKVMLTTGKLSGKSAINLSSLLSQIDSWKQAFIEKTPFNATKLMLEESGYVQDLKIQNTDEARERLDNLNEMLTAIAEFDDIASYIEHTSLVMEHDNDKDNNPTISVMTLHAAKGLEFTAVFLPGWEEGVFPSGKTLNEDNIKGVEEERRIAYVGITRAKKKLYITYADSRKIFHEFVKSTPSRFLGEIPNSVVNRISSTQTIPHITQILRKHDKIERSEPNGPGTKVEHPVFGLGVVVRKTGDNLEIAFYKAGLKTIKESFLKTLE